MSDFGRWAKGLLKNHGASMSGEASGALEELPPWIADLGEPVDDLRRLVELLARDLSAAQASAEDWERKHDKMGDEATRFENERDDALRRVRELEEELQEVRNEQ